MQIHVVVANKHEAFFGPFKKKPTYHHLAASKNVEIAEKLVAFLSLWMFSPSGASMTQRLKAFAMLRKLQPMIPRQLRVAKPVLYRAVVLNPTLEKSVTRNIQKNKSVLAKFKSRPYSSWTESAAFAENFAKNFLWTGRSNHLTLILKKEIPRKQVVLNIPATYKWVVSKIGLKRIRLLLGSRADKFIEWFKSEKEIIVANTADDKNLMLTDVVKLDGQPIKQAAKLRRNANGYDKVIADIKQALVPQIKKWKSAKITVETRIRKTKRDGLKFSLAASKGNRRIYIDSIKDKYVAISKYVGSRNRYRKLKVSLLRNTEKFVDIVSRNVESL